MREVEPGHQAQRADQPAHVPVGLGAVRAQPGFVGAVLPHRVDLHQPAEQEQHGRGREQHAQRAERVGRPQRRADHVALRAPGARELGVLLAHDDRQVQADQRHDDHRDDEDMDDEQSVDEGARAGEVAVPDQHRQLAADERDRQDDAVGDGQAHAREQVVGQRVAGEALDDAQRHQRDPDEPVDVARLAERAGEEHAHQVHDHRHDEDQRGPVVGLPDDQPGRHIERDPERRVVGLRHLHAVQRRVAAGVGGRRRRGVEEEREVRPRDEQDDERVERDLPEQEGPVVGEQVAHPRADQRGDAEALVDEADGVGGGLLVGDLAAALEQAHVPLRTPHQAGPMLPS